VLPIAPYPDLKQGHPYAQDPEEVKAAADAAIQDLLKTDLSSLKLLLVSGWRMVGHTMQPGVLLARIIHEGVN
jgi:hypothetical protein